MTKMKEKCKEFTTCVCLIFSGVCLIVGFFVVELVMAVIAISLLLPVNGF